jgi:anti-sigma factor RsiW
MSPEERAPTRDEMLAMAYADGELDEAAAAAFEARLASEPALARELAELRQLAVLARRIAPPEPADYEWRRLEAEWLHGGGQSFGLLLLALAALGLGGCAIWWLFASALPIAVKVFAWAGLVGILLLLGLAIRARRRTLPFDPYTQVKR